jgi:hypothetical protein
MKAPLAVLIETRIKHLGIDRAALGLRLGYRNPAKAAGRVYALCDGHITSTKSKTALRRLPEAIEVPAEVVETAVNATLSFLAELKRQEDEKLRIGRENEDAAWRATSNRMPYFRGNARLQPRSRCMPSQEARSGGLKSGLTCRGPPSPSSSRFWPHCRAGFIYEKMGNGLSRFSAPRWGSPSTTHPIGRSGST